MVNEKKIFFLHLQTLSTSFESLSLKKIILYFFFYLGRHLFIPAAVFLFPLALSLKIKNNNVMSAEFWFNGGGWIFFPIFFAIFLLFIFSRQDRIRKNHYYFLWTDLHLFLLLNFQHLENKMNPQNKMESSPALGQGKIKVAAINLLFSCLFLPLFSLLLILDRLKNKEPK